MLYIVNRALMAVFFRLRVEGRSNLPGNRAASPGAESRELPRPGSPRRRPAAQPAAGGPLGGVERTDVRDASHASAQPRLPGFPARPKRGGLAGLAAAESLLEQQQTVVWFPEGRRSPDGRLQPFTPGIGLLMARTGIAAVPVRIKGSFEAWPLSRRLPRPRRVSVIFGRPIGRDQLALDGAGDEVDRHIAEQLRRAVAALADGERQE
jgi:long-chain acyl-CoA synthetase